MELLRKAWQRLYLRRRLAHPPSSPSSQRPRSLEWSGVSVSFLALACTTKPYTPMATPISVTATVVTLNHSGFPGIPPKAVPNPNSANTKPTILKVSAWLDRLSFAMLLRFHRREQHYFT